MLQNIKIILLTMGSFLMIYSSAENDEARTIIFRRSDICSLPEGKFHTLVELNDYIDCIKASTRNRYGKRNIYQRELPKVYSSDSKSEIQDDNTRILYRLLNLTDY